MDIADEPPLDPAHQVGEKTHGSPAIATKKLLEASLKKMESTQPINLARFVAEPDERAPAQDATPDVLSSKKKFEYKLDGALSGSADDLMSLEAQKIPLAKDT